MEEYTGATIPLDQPSIADTKPFVSNEIVKQPYLQEPPELNVLGKLPPGTIPMPTQFPDGNSTVNMCTIVTPMESVTDGDYEVHASNLALTLDNKSDGTHLIMSNFILPDGRTARYLELDLPANRVINNSNVFQKGFLRAMHGLPEFTKEQSEKVQEQQDNILPYTIGLRCLLLSDGECIMTLYHKDTDKMPANLRRPERPLATNTGVSKVFRRGTLDEYSTTMLTDAIINCASDDLNQDLKPHSLARKALVSLKRDKDKIRIPIGSR